MTNPTELRYTKSHEWVKELDNGNVQVGLTDHAQKELGDLVFINLPEPGDELTVGESFGDVESVKAVSDVYSPVSGVVAAVNQELLDHPEAVNQSAYDAWLVEVENVSHKEELLTAQEYDQFVAEEEA